MKLLIIALFVSLISISIGINGTENGVRGIRDGLTKGLTKTNSCFRSLSSVLSCIKNFSLNDILVDINPVSWKVPLPEKFEGRYEENTLLEEAQKLFQNEVLGPESLGLAPNGDLYTGTGAIGTEAGDGAIYRISNDKLSLFAKLEGVRPLGIRYHRNGYLYVLADLGLFQIFMNQTVVKVFGIEDMIFSNINDKSSKFIDDFTIIYGEGINGGDVIYFSDVSTKFNLHQFIYSLLEPDSTGRIIKYDINAKNFTIIMKDLWFPNGVEVNDANNALIVCELTKRRILKHYIKGPNKGKTQVITSEIPGEPDNIRRSLSSNETYWVAINSVRNASNPLIGDILSEAPFKRKLYIKALYIVSNILRYLGQIFNYNPLVEFGDHLGGYIIPFAQMPGMAIEIDFNGNILRTLQSPNNIYHSISEVREVKNENNERTLYIGSAFNPYVGKLILKT